MLQWEFRYTWCISCPSLSQSSMSSWTIHSESIQMYRTPIVRASVMASSMFLFRILVKRISGTGVSLNVAFRRFQKGFDRPQQWLSVTYCACILSLTVLTIRIDLTAHSSPGSPRSTSRVGTNPGPDLFGLHFGWLRTQSATQSLTCARDCAALVLGPSSAAVGKRPRSGLC